MTSTDLRDNFTTINIYQSSGYLHFIIWEIDVFVTINDVIQSFLGIDIKIRIDVQSIRIDIYTNLDVNTQKRL